MSVGIAHVRSDDGGNKQWMRPTELKAQIGGRDATHPSWQRDVQFGF